MTQILIVIAGIAIILGARSWGESLVKTVVVLAIAGPLLAMSVNLIAQVATEHPCIVGLGAMIACALVGFRHGGGHGGGQSGHDHKPKGTSTKRRTGDHGSH